MERIDGISGRILEMVQDGKSAINIDNDPRVNIQELTKDDQAPMFVILEVIRAGVSKVNRREYDNKVVSQISEMIPGTIGYLGHPDPNKTSFEFRDPQTIYVGSRIEELAGGITRALGKAYIFKSSPLREWVPKSIAAGNPLTVSINGTGDILPDATRRVLKVQEMRSLDSIDWANPGTEGVGTAQAINIVSEMQDNEGGEIKMPDVFTKTPEVIRGITLAEMRAYNTDVVDGLIRGVTVAELQSKNPDLVKAIQDSAKITELQLKVDGQDKTVRLTELQGVIDAQATKITELQNSIATLKITEYKNKKIAELVPEAIRSKVEPRITGATEADIDKSIQSEVAYIKEMMGDSVFDNLPKGNPGRKDPGADMKAAMQSLFDVKIKKDDQK